MIAIDLSKQQALDADPRAIKQINFTPNLDRGGKTRIYFILKKQKKLSQTFRKELQRFCECNSIEWFNFYQYKTTQYNSLNVKQSNSQLNKLKSAIKK